MFDPIAYINEPRWQKVSLGLSRTRLLLEKLGRPQDRLRFVHVAGTNGKGSTCAFLESVLRQAGYRTGLFTSPYIECFEERIRVRGQNIPLDALRAVTLRVRDAAVQVAEELGEHPTEFELMTAVALCHFANEQCDIVVLEVGLGGRLDSTNVVERPDVCVITPIALDHTAILGNTLAAVAGEKAGICKPGVPVVSWPQEPTAMAVVRAQAEDLGCPLAVMDLAQLEVEPLTADFMRPFCYRDHSYQTQLLGAYQPANAAMALEAIEALRAKGWDIPESAVEAGIAQAQWPGRFELAARDPLTIIDGGHNPQGAQALADSLAELVASMEVPTGRHPERSEGSLPAERSFDSGLRPPLRMTTGRVCVHFVMGVLADKDYPAMIRAVAPFAESFTVYAPENPRALPAEDLASTIAAECDAPVMLAESAESALRQARTRASEDAIIVAFGSLYAIADLRKGLSSPLSS